ncbi:MAG: aminotransferase class V-fold PLP-dependent enzyme, partial [Christensenellaceae bacterium]|nr:aminotransferase class V-fold PLP-dependent enzyme [Christensenellaceae bacterium]
IVARDFHRSVENAIALAGVQPVYVALEQQLGCLPAVVETAALVAAMDACPDAKAVFFTYPNYYGLCPDAERIAAEAHKRGMLVVVDGAHGAHLPYGEGLPIDLGAAGADIWSVSYHKTLPALNQAAVLFASARVDAHRLKQRLNLFQTTSPSYLILASMGYARGWMAACGKQALAGLSARTQRFEQWLTANTPFARVVTPDYTKLIIRVADAGINGFDAAEALAKKGIHIEGADAAHLLLMSSVCTREEDWQLLEGALIELADRPCGQTRLCRQMPIVLGGQVPWKIDGPAVQVEWQQAAGKLAAESVFAYPPGVPLVLRGQQICPELPELLAEMRDTGYNLIGTDGRTLAVAEPADQ